MAGRGEFCLDQRRVGGIGNDERGFQIETSEPAQRIAQHGLCVEQREELLRSI